MSHKLIIDGYMLTNDSGKTDRWQLTIGDETRLGSLFELKRVIKFYRELGVIPEVRSHTLPPATSPGSTLLRSRR